MIVTASAACGEEAASRASVAFAPGPVIPVRPRSAAADVRFRSISCRVAFTSAVNRVSAADVDPVVGTDGVPFGEGGAEVQPAASTRATIRTRRGP